MNCVEDEQRFVNWATLDATPTAVLPAFLGSLGAAAAWLGIIEGIADGLSSFAKLGSGFYADGLPRHKPIALIGYLITASEIDAIYRHLSSLIHND